MEELVSSGYVTLDESIRERWEFTVTWPDEFVAISKELPPRGVGNKIKYDILQGYFTESFHLEALQFSLNSKDIDNSILDRIKFGKYRLHMAFWPTKENQKLDYKGIRRHLKKGTESGF